MAQTIILDSAEAKALCQLARQIIDKFTAGITAIRTLTSDLDPVLSGGQGETIKGILNNLSGAMNKLQTCINVLNSKIAQKERAISDMEASTGKFMNCDNIIAEATAKANARA